MSKDMLLQAFVRAEVFKYGIKKRLVKSLGAVVAASPVMAFAGDIADMASNAATGAESTQKSALKVATFVGVCFVITGLIMAKNKKDNPQIKVSHIIGAILFGVCLVVVPEIIKRSQAQVGLAPVDVG